MGFDLAGDKSRIGNVNPDVFIWSEIYSCQFINPDVDEVQGYGSAER